MIKSLCLIVVTLLSTQTFATQIFSFNELNARLKKDLAPYSPNFENAFPCGQEKLYTHTEKSVYNGPVGPGSTTDDTSIYELKVICKNAIPHHFKFTQIKFASYEDDSQKVMTESISKSEYEKREVAGEFEYLVFHLFDSENVKDSVKLKVSTYKNVSLKMGAKQVDAIHLVASAFLLDEGEWLEIGQLDYTFAKGLPKSQELVKEDSTYFYPGFYGEHRQQIVTFK